MPQIKEAFVGSQLKYKIYITISTQFCSDVSFIGTIFSSIWHLIFVLSFLISDLLFVFCYSHYWYLFNLLFRRSFFVSWVNTTVRPKMCC